MLKKFFQAAFMLACLTAAAPAHADPLTGEAAPAFTLPAADGGTASLADYKGKLVVLEWHNKGCPFVHKQYDSGNMQALQKEYTAKDVIWLTINSSAEGKQGYETAAEALATAKDDDAAPTHVLLDADGKVGKLYGAKTTPSMFVIDKDGKLAYAGAIDDKPSTDVDDVKTAKNYVRAALDALAAGKPVETASTKSYGCGVKYAD
ncbi:MAG: thioredoxin family protein [Micavibrio sp.]|nr:thioredoxin family protein [Micavibrio sp.]